MMSDRLFVRMMGDRIFVGIMSDRLFVGMMSDRLSVGIMGERSLQGLLSTFLLHYKGYSFSVEALIMRLTKFAVGVCRG
jgi:hypothetical protein